MSQPHHLPIPQSTQLWGLIETARSINSISHLQDFCQTLLLEAMALADAESGAFYLVRGQNQKTCLQLQSMAHQGALITIDHNQYPPIPCWRGDRPRYDRAIIKAALNRETLELSNASECEHFDFLQEDLLRVNPLMEIESVLAAPIIAQNDSIIAVIQLCNAKDTVTDEIVAFNIASQQAVEALCGLVSAPLMHQMASMEQRSLLVRLSRETTIDKLFDRILWEAQVITGAEGGTLYLVNDQLEKPMLEFKVFHNYALNIRNYFSKGRQLQNTPIPLYHMDGKPNYHNVASYAAILKQTVNIPNAYESTEFDFSGTKDFDAVHDYTSQSFLTVPLLSHDDEVIGILQLINARDVMTHQVEPFSKHHEDIVKALAAYAAVILNNQLLIEEHKRFLDAFIKCMARSIDAKSNYTGLNCQRVPELIEMIAQACCDDKDVLPDFQLNEEEWYELHVASWLHDCGKLATPDQILNKATKLHLMHDTIEDVYHRLELVKREKRIELISKPCEHPLQAIRLSWQYYQFAMMINDEKDFLNRANIGVERMTAADQERICSIAQRCWYDDSGHACPVLSEMEVDYLCIQSGTLSMEERKRINDHIVLTIDMLESLPFPKKLRNVPEFAGGLHEKIDGSGYPRGLTGEELSLPTKMMAIADVFEALTAEDRTYKKPMKISKALSVLQQMRDNQHIDPDVYRVFLQARVWEQYAKKYLAKDQLDISEYQTYL